MQVQLANSIISSTMQGELRSVLRMCADMLRMGNTCPRPAKSSEKAIHSPRAFFQPENEQLCS